MTDMSNKTLSIYFAVFAILYVVYTVVIVGHGVHWSNSIVTITVLFLAIYYYFKDRRELSKEGKRKKA